MITQVDNQIGLRFYTVYRTQNIVNGKYYFGVHKTKNPYDGYLGSGKVLGYAIAKYGKQAFIKNVCFIFDNPEEAFAKEFELIETYRGDPLCYNLRQGGSGGFDWINAQPEHHYDIKGQRFGRLMALSREGSNKNGMSIWMMLCDCGVTKKVGLNGLMMGKTKGCGRCLKTSNLKGFKYGRLTVVSYAPFPPVARQRGSRWVCICDCGKIKTVPAKHLKSGDAKSCGCGREKWVKV